MNHIPYTLALGTLLLFSACQQAEEKVQTQAEERSAECVGCLQENDCKTCKQNGFCNGYECK